MSAVQRRGAFRPRRWAWLLLLVALLAPAWELFLPAGPFPPARHATIVIERRESLRAVATDLQRAGVVHSPFGFLVLARLMNLDRHIKAGEYAFRLGITVPALLRALDRGMYGLDLLTIPEGLTLAEISDLLGARLGVRAQAIDSLAHDPALLDSLHVAAPSLEGYLAPDSYGWLPGTPPEVVLRTMVEHTHDRVARATADCDSLPLGFDTHRLLTLASIVEAEAQAASERPRIARVYLNRLQREMRLQADPTVGYALGRNPRSRLSLRDLRVESPYNTYLHDGLPPGPICAPGYASIEAVVHASPLSNELYFVARGDGHHLFAATFAQHLANISAAHALQAAEARDDSAEDAPPDSAR
ncbi:MAG TPA: endolytic transglycosylase MltG [Candidatus Acidoferrales bacterium]|nr:endolytic transglycosylase MltG [Candidatus Acidoferrales bacterium]